MTSTAVKEVSNFFSNVPVAQADKNTAGASAFQNVWNDQMNRHAAPSRDNGAGAAEKSVSGEKPQKASLLKKTVENRVVQKETEPPAEIPAVDQEQAMEVLGTAAMQLMQKVADAFGMTVEQLQEVMGSLGMEQLDMLDASRLSVLLLNLGGAEDLYALVTDGELYENYQALMDQLKGVLQESADSLGIDPGQLQQILAERPESGAPVQEVLPQPQQPKEEAPVLEQETEYRKESVEEPVEERPAAEIYRPQETGETVQESPQQSQTGSERGGRHSEGKTAGEPAYNLFLQNLRTEQFQPQEAQLQNVQSSPWSEGTQEIMNQILDYMKLQLNADTTNLEMQLHPASLGTLQIQLASKAGAVTANFIAQNEAVKAALEVQMVQLKEQFEAQGIKVESIEVTVQSHAFERNLDEQGRGRGQQPERRGRTRRVASMGTVSMEEGAETPAPDQIATGSSTVEYTA